MSTDPSFAMNEVEPHLKLSTMEKIENTMTATSSRRASPSCSDGTARTRSSASSTSSSSSSSDTAAAEESNLQALFAERTARGMADVVEWWKRQQLQKRRDTTAEVVGESRFCHLLDPDYGNRNDSSTQIIKSPSRILTMAVDNQTTGLPGNSLVMDTTTGCDYYWDENSGSESQQISNCHSEDPTVASLNRAFCNARKSILASEEYVERCIWRLTSPNTSSVSSSHRSTSRIPSQVLINRQTPLKNRKKGRLERVLGGALDDEDGNDSSSCPSSSTFSTLGVDDTSSWNCDARPRSSTRSAAIIDSAYAGEQTAIAMESCCCCCYGAGKVDARSEGMTTTTASKPLTNPFLGRLLSSRCCAGASGRAVCGAIVSCFVAAVGPCLIIVFTCYWIASRA